MNDVLLYIRNFANFSAADRAKQYKKSEVFEVSYFVDPIDIV